MLDSLVQDGRQAVRDLRAAPLFTGVAVMTLAVGIGATTAVFSAVNATLLRPLPYADPDALIDVRTRFADGRATTGLVANSELAALTRHTAVVVDAAGVQATPIDATLLGTDGTPTRLAMAGVSHRYFETLGLPLQRGRSFTSEEHGAAGANPPVSVVLSSRLWSTMFGKAEGIVGDALRIAELAAPATVVGVAAPELDLPGGPDAWFNFRFRPDDSSHMLSGVVRLQPGVTLAGLQAVAPAVMAEVAQAVPNAVGREFVLRTLLSSSVGDLRPILLVVLGATAVLLLLACINVTNLSLARGLSRHHDAAMRSALGASPARLLQQHLAQSLLLAAVGAAGGVLVAHGALRVFLAAGGAALPRLDAVSIDVRVLAFVTVVAVLAGVISGVLPAMRLARADGRALIQQGATRSGHGAATSRLMSGLIVAEVALALALVAGAGWLVQSYDRLRAIDSGFATGGRVIVDVRPAEVIRGTEHADAWTTDLLTRVRAAAPGVVAGAAWTYPLRADRDGTTDVERLASESRPDRPQTTHSRPVSDGFFEAMGIRLLAGRTFTADDRRDSERVVIVSRSFARRVFGGADPLGERLAFGTPRVDRSTPWRVVGVVDDVRYASLTAAPEPTYYLPIRQTAFPNPNQSLVVSSPSNDAVVLLEQVGVALHRFDPTLVVTLTPAARVVDAATRQQHLGRLLMTTFGGAAVLLAAVGLYGVVGYVASTRRRELATRLALGATRGQMLWMMLGSARHAALAGGAIGVALAYAGGRLLASRVFDIAPDDAGILLGAWLVVAVVTLVAAALPALRASREDPIRALRAD